MIQIIIIKIKTSFAKNIQTIVSCLQMKNINNHVMRQLTL